MTRTSISHAISAACAAVALCASLSAIAKAAPPDGATPAGEGAAGAPSASTPALETSPATSTAFTDAKLEKFADAYVAVQNLQKDAGQAASTNSTSSANSAASTAGDMQAKMKAAVEQTGLKVEEFNQIAQQMVTDLDLRAKVAEKVQARAGRG